MIYCFVGFCLCLITFVISRILEKRAFRAYFERDPSMNDVSVDWRLQSLHNRLTTPHRVGGFATYGAIAFAIFAAIIGFVQRHSH